MHQLLCTHFRYFKRTPPLSPCTQEHQRAHVADDDPGYKVWAALMAIRKAHCKWQRRTHKGVHQARFGSCNVSSAPLLGRGIMRGSVRGREGDGVILGPAWLLRVLMQLLRVNMCVKGHVEIQLLHAMVRTKMQVRVCAKTQLTAACGGFVEYSTWQAGFPLLALPHGLLPGSCPACLPHVWQVCLQFSCSHQACTQGINPMSQSLRGFQEQWQQAVTCALDGRFSCCCHPF
mmetsp:Transcript_7172/g.19255  ORF Transcript_7172/g.19255 Transcript_7172/m.19255 type:complete len:232 (+) Transcript_7172:297-992(+)